MDGLANSGNKLLHVRQSYVRDRLSLYHQFCPLQQLEPQLVPARPGLNQDPVLLQGVDQVLNRALVHPQASGDV